MALKTNIPDKVIQIIIPILLTQLKDISKITTRLKNLAASIPVGAKCNDPVIKNLKRNLEKLNKLISNIRKILKVLEKIRKALNITAGVASGIAIAQTLIPLPPGAPPGPIAKLLNIATNLGTNCKSAVMVLSGLLATIDLAISMAEIAIANTLKAISNLCTSEDIEVSNAVAQIMSNNLVNTVLGELTIDNGTSTNNNINSSKEAADNGTSTNNNINSSKEADCIVIRTEIIRGRAIASSKLYTNVVSITDGDGVGATFDINVINGQYVSVNVNQLGNGYRENDQITITGNLLGGISPNNDLLLRVRCVSKNNYTESYDSLFYTKYNVSFDDLDVLQNDVDELAEDAKSVLTNLIEAPSSAFIEYSSPTNNIGKVGDFYIDLANNMIYGPKPADDVWDNGIKY